MSEAALSLPSSDSQLSALSSQHETPALLFRVPDDELTAFWEDLRDPAQQAFVNNTLSAIEEIHHARNRKSKAQEIADRYLGTDNFSAKTLLNKHRLYVHGGYKSGVKRPENFVRAGDWKALVPNYWLPEKKYHQGFLDFLAELAGMYRRDSSDGAAIRDLKLTLWPAGKPIPGYGTWKDEFRRRFKGEAVPHDCPPDFWPAGWSDRQLYRLLPAADHLEIVRHGVAAGEDLLPQIMNDRTALHFGQVLIIDDFWAPFKVAYKRSIDYCMGLAAIDWASGAWVHHALMPREQLPDGTRKSLTAGHMKWFIIGLLRVLRGLPQDRIITILVENNTASASTEVAEIIHQTFQGRVIIKRSGLLKGKEGSVLEHGFRESGGKWRADGKGLIESGFNLLKNEMAGMPGQRGSKERTNGHAADGDMQKYALALLQNEALTDAHVALLKLPYLRYADALAITKQIFDRINGYRDHKCRGFEQVEEWRLSEKDNWTLYGVLPTPEQQALLDQGAVPLRRSKPESRLMRALRLRAELTWTPIPDSAFIPLQADRLKPVVVNAKKQIVINRTGADALVFFSKRAFEAGLLTPGTEYRGFYYEDEPDAIQLTPKDSLRHLGYVERFGAVNPMDEAAKGEAYKHTMAPKRAVRAEIQRVHAPADAGLLEMRTHNDAVRLAAETGQAFVQGAAQARVTARKQTAADVRRRDDLSAQLAEQARQSASGEEPIL